MRLVSFDIALVIAGHEIDGCRQSAKRRDVLETEVAAVEQVAADQQTVEFQLAEPVADSPQMGRRVGPDMHITDEGQRHRPCDSV